MIKISHRGNINGPNPEKENHPDYIIAALNQGYGVEIDIWHVHNKFWLGHDAPQYEIDLSFLKQDRFPDYGKNRLWIHSKNIAAAYELSQYWDLTGPTYNLFFHQNDDCIITTLGYIWTYPGKLIYGEKSIAVMPELVPSWDISKAGGICSDYIGNYGK